MLRSPDGIFYYCSLSAGGADIIWWVNFFFCGLLAGYIVEATMISWLRNQYWQLKLTVLQRNSFAKIRQQALAMYKIKPPHGEPWRKRKDQLWGIAMVKNELDVLPAVVEHLFAQGVDRLLISDNNSTDGTYEYLVDLERNDPRVRVVKDPIEAYIQSEKMTWLAHLAWRYGARWIIPFDADEFWFAPNQNLKDELLGSNADVLYARFRHGVPTTETFEVTPELEIMLDTTPAFPGKVAFRSHPLAVLGPGNHEVARTGSREHGLDILHLIYRNRQQIARKFSQGTQSALKTKEDLESFTPHWTKGSTLSAEEIGSVWQNISSGKPDPRILYKAVGPMRRGRFIMKKTWNDALEA